jgi:hypothetical protein
LIKSIAIVGNRSVLFYRESMVPIMTVIVPGVVRAPIIVIIVVVMPPVVVNRDIDSHPPMIGITTRYNRSDDHRQKREDS